MDVIDSQIDTRSELFRTNSARLMALVAELRERTAVVRRGGGDRYVQRHREQGKLPVRERIDKLLDPHSPFLELSPLAAWGLYDNEAPAAGIVTGIGRVSGREVMIDGAHLCDAIGKRNQLRLAVAACHDDVQIMAAIAQRSDHVVDGKIIVAQCDVKFVQDQQPN